MIPRHTSLEQYRGLQITCIFPLSAYAIADSRSPEQTTVFTTLNRTMFDRCYGYEMVYYIHLILWAYRKLRFIKNETAVDCMLCKIDWSRRYISN